MLRQARTLDLTESSHDSRYDRGKYPSVATNNNGLIVEVVQNSMLGIGSSLLSYRVGKYIGRRDTQGGSQQRRQNEIAWISKNGPDSEERILYAKGQYPRVSINNAGKVITVHQNDDQCFYCIGQIADDNNIDWFYKEQSQVIGRQNVVMATPKPLIERLTTTSSATQLGETIPRKMSLPSVALNDRDEAIIIFENRDRAYYCTGTFPNRSQPGMEWSSLNTVTGLCGEITEVCVAMNSQGTIAIVYRRSARVQLYFAYGSLDENQTLQLPYRGENPFGYGWSPVVSINSEGYFVIAAQSWAGRKKQFWIDNINNIPKNAFTLFPASAGNEFGFGCYPTIAINDANQVVEVHETNFEPARMKNSLFYRTGTLKGSESNTVDDTSDNIS